MTMTDEVNLLVKKIADYCRPEKIILFGSVARGETKKGSDIDLLIIKRSNKKRPFRVKEVFEAVRGVNRSYSLDPIVYTPEEYLIRLELGDHFIREISKEGKTVYAN